MRIRMLPSRVAFLALSLSATLAAPARAQDVGVAAVRGTSEGTAWTSVVRYGFDGPRTWRNLDSQAYLDHGHALWSDPASTHQLALGLHASLGAAGRLDDRTDFAQGLLLPGTAGLGVGATHVWTGPHGMRFAFPGADLGAKVVPLASDTTVYQVGLGGSAAMSVRDRFGLSLRIGRAVNALGRDDRRRVLASVGGAALWSTYLVTAAGLHVRPGDFYLTSTFGAFLGDSKFAVPLHGRRVVTLGLAKSYGAHRG